MKISSPAILATASSELQQWSTHTVRCVSVDHRCSCGDAVPGPGRADRAAWQDHGMKAFE
jgi:hypothetical protein